MGISTLQLHFVTGYLTGTITVVAFAVILHLARKGSNLPYIKDIAWLSII